MLWSYYFEGENSALTEYKRWLFTVPVSEAGLCVTHWASGSRFAANYIRLTFSRVWWGDFLERLSLAFVWSRQGFWERCWESVHCEVAARHLQTPDEPKLQPGNQHFLLKLNDSKKSTVQIIKINRGLGRISSPTPVINNILATIINILVQLTQVVVYVRTPRVPPLHSHPSFPPIWCM